MTDTTTCISCGRDIEVIVEDGEFQGGECHGDISLPTEDAEVVGEETLDDGTEVIEYSDYRTIPWWECDPCTDDEVLEAHIADDLVEMARDPDDAETPLLKLWVTGDIAGKKAERFFENLFADGDDVRFSPEAGVFSNATFPQKTLSQLTRLSGIQFIERDD